MFWKSGLFLGWSEPDGAEINLTTVSELRSLNTTSQSVTAWRLVVQAKASRTRAYVFANEHWASFWPASKIAGRRGRGRLYSTLGVRTSRRLCYLHFHAAQEQYPSADA